MKNTFKIRGLIIVMSLIAFSLTAKPLGKIQTNKNNDAISKDSTISVEIQRQLTNGELSLYYPNSVKRFYRKNDFNPQWLMQQSGTGTTWQAMLLIDCVLQFGLSHDDYHPQELTYDELHTILDKPASIPLKQQARFDIMLTDGMIALINNLHFGKLNPDYPAEKIDNSLIGFHAENGLENALSQGNFMASVMQVQPKSKEYVDMQYHMRLWAGLYTGDCYDVPDTSIRKLAINMERLRWADIDTGAFIQINIPSFALNLYEADSVYNFKVVVGKPSNPSPTLQSQINYFTTTPEWKVPDKIFREEILPKTLSDPTYLEKCHYVLYDSNGKYIEPTMANLLSIAQTPKKYHATQSAGCGSALGAILFRFPNIYDVYLHDTPEQQLFNESVRDFSQGCIRVEHADNLAKLLLRYDNAADKIGALTKALAKHRTINFNLNKPLPIKITYLTCIVKDGEVLNYKDIYNLDNKLEMALYNVSNDFAAR